MRASWRPSPGGPSPDFTPATLKAARPLLIFDRAAAFPTAPAREVRVPTSSSISAGPIRHQVGEGRAKHAKAARELGQKLGVDIERSILPAARTTFGFLRGRGQRQRRQMSAITSGRRAVCAPAWREPGARAEDGQLHSDCRKDRVRVRGRLPPSDRAIRRDRLCVGTFLGRSLGTESRARRHCREVKLSPATGTWP